MRKREGALHARHLVVIELHRVDGAAAVRVVLGVGTEDAGQQDSRSPPGIETSTFVLARRLARERHSLRSQRCPGRERGAPDACDPSRGREWARRRLLI